MLSFNRIIKKSKHKTIDTYILEKKYDIYVYVFMLIVLIPLTIYFFQDVYIVIVGLIAYLLIIYSKIYEYYTYRKIKKHLIDNDLIDKIGDILFCNNRNYFLTDNYVVIVVQSVVNCFSYDDIKSIYKTRKITGSLWHNEDNSYFEYLYIVTEYNEFEIVTYTTALINEDFYDISDFLLEKNSNIIVEKNHKKQ